MPAMAAQASFENPALALQVKRSNLNAGLCAHAAITQPSGKPSLGGVRSGEGCAHQRIAFACFAGDSRPNRMPFIARSQRLGCFHCRQPPGDDEMGAHLRIRKPAGVHVFDHAVDAKAPQHEVANRIGVVSGTPSRRNDEGQPSARPNHRRGQNPSRDGQVGQAGVAIHQAAPEHRFRASHLVSDNGVQAGAHRLCPLTVSVAALAANIGRVGNDQIVRAFRQRLRDLGAKGVAGDDLRRRPVLAQLVQSVPTGLGRRFVNLHAV